MDVKTDSKQASVDSTKDGVTSEAQNNASVVLPTERGRLTRWAAVSHVINAASLSCLDRTYKFLCAMLVKEIFSVCRFGRWVWSWAVPGLGMFNESYYIFSVGNVKPIWTEQYPECWKVISQDRPMSPTPFSYIRHRAGFAHDCAALTIATSPSMHVAGGSWL